MNETKPSNPKDRAATDRIDLSLFPDTAVVYGALGMTEGDCKYGAYNYRPGGVQASVYVAAARRHLAKWWNGHEEDPKTGVPHLASALSCIAILIDAVECGVLKDNRPPSIDMESLIDRTRANVKKLQEMYPDGPDRYTEKEHGKVKNNVRELPGEERMLSETVVDGRVWVNGRVWPGEPHDPDTRFTPTVKE